MIETMSWPMSMFPSSIIPFLCALLTYAIYIIYKNHRKRNEPAVVFSFIPVLGSAISFGSDPLHFLRSNTRRLGSTFCAVIAGNRTVFVNDPEDWQEILRLPKSAMNFDDIGKEVLVSSFYMDSGTADAVQFEGSKVLHGQFVKVGLPTTPSLPPPQT